MGLEDFSLSSELACTKVVPLGLPGAEEINDAYHTIRSVVSIETDLRRINIWKSFEKSDFFKYCQSYVSTAIQIAKTIKKGKPVMIQTPKTMIGHNGENTTNVLTALTQLLVDPYFRTYEGFLALIEKEWTMFFTFCFSSPSEMYSNAIFVLFLHCVWNCHNLKPEAFEFDLSMLDHIHASLYSTKYHDFVFTSRHERWLVSTMGEVAVTDAGSDEDDSDGDVTSKKSTCGLVSSPVPISPISSLPTSPKDSSVSTPTSTPPVSPHGTNSNPPSSRSHVSSQRSRGLMGVSLIRNLLRKRKKVMLTWNFL